LTEGVYNTVDHLPQYGSSLAPKRYILLRGDYNTVDHLFKNGTCN
jgi:hypothetical protein